MNSLEKQLKMIQRTREKENTVKVNSELSLEINQSPWLFEVLRPLMADRRICLSYSFLARQNQDLL